MKSKLLRIRIKRSNRNNRKKTNKRKNRRSKKIKGGSHFGHSGRSGRSGRSGSSFHSFSSGRSGRSFRSGRLPALVNNGAPQHHSVPVSPQGASPNTHYFPKKSANVQSREISLRVNHSLSGKLPYYIKSIGDCFIREMLSGDYILWCNGKDVYFKKPYEKRVVEPPLEHGKHFSVKKEPNQEFTTKLIHAPFVNVRETTEITPIYRCQCCDKHIQLKNLDVLYDTALKPSSKSRFPSIRNPKKRPPWRRESKGSSTGPKVPTLPNIYNPPK